VLNPTARLGSPILIADHSREKLLGAVAFFAANTGKCGKVKLFKLLYFLDFGHYRETGRCVTGLDYYAWKFGPVPTALMDELEQPEPDFAERISVEHVPTKKGEMTLIKPVEEPDLSNFSQRELLLMRDLASRYRDSDAEEMIEATHLETLPWHRVFEVEGRRQGEIPYSYSLKKEEESMVLEISKENREILRNYQ
jgi:uncharacterized phage-associated protein